jgi:hypothetical protein
MRFLLVLCLLLSAVPAVAKEKGAKAAKVDKAAAVERGPLARKFVGTWKIRIGPEEEAAIKMIEAIVAESPDAKEREEAKAMIAALRESR